MGARYQSPSVSYHAMLFVRIQEMHKIYPAGVWVPMSARNSVSLTIDQRKYEDVIEWMQEALKRMSALYEYSSALTKIDVLEYLSSDKYKVGLNDTQAIVRRHLSDSLERVN